MAGTLVLDTLKDGSANTRDVTTLVKGPAKAYANWVGSSGAINQSYNVSSITRSTTGTYVVNFTSALPTANYVIAGGCDPGGDGAGTLMRTPATSLTTGTASVRTVNFTTTFDATNVWAAFFGG
jgi:hypothetical protein